MMVMPPPLAQFISLLALLLSVFVARADKQVPGVLDASGRAQ
jgi:hypothetical protein